MGPECPHCGVTYEWTCGELEEFVTAPKIYFCERCREMFVCSPEQVAEAVCWFALGGEAPVGRLDRPTGLGERGRHALLLV